MELVLLSTAVLLRFEPTPHFILGSIYSDQMSYNAPRSTLALPEMHYRWKALYIFYLLTLSSLI
ncbi:unnamed protein product [Fusarium graminearum]|nr:unnamed protein product [Fusarium graminearum]CAG1975524.1 unnamed protein product [Fusarium graminearum]